MALVPHKRKQPDTDTSSDTDTGSLAPRVLVRRRVNGGRALNGPEGWFPGADIPYETMRKFEGASKSSKPPASEADLKIARKAVEDAWRSLDKDDAPGKKGVFSMLPAIGKGGVTMAVVKFVLKHDAQGRTKSPNALAVAKSRGRGTRAEQDERRKAEASAEAGKRRKKAETAGRTPGQIGGHTGRKGFIFDSEGGSTGTTTASTGGAASTRCGTA